ncbi:hypothetical protein [Wenxinia marina]|uniref:Uncharacterized protein n=1 Tax=Wenxinia marina DSM 24838 TaxID=1123501 RepID=A0A0D0Q8V4_9RHOB|nr:hypothetical protein [Wenxinia marina]KIQ70839.1 hypothetical protein Wenmar_00213 [Wenxinia marina DSM 24838]GGL56899.1 hypothetical protein GCM10011392_09200 [Wenxinia marina]
MRGAALALALLPASAAAEPYDGIYRQAENADCALVGADGGSVRIADGVFEGVGSQCLMTLPVDVVDMDATLYTMECAAGGEAWTERAMLMHTPDRDGLFMIWNGYAFRYDRCPDDTVPVEPGAAGAAGPDDAAD